MAKWTKLALKGGGAKGFVYIGVAQALEELKILQDIDEIAGSSVGAIGCLMLSSGLSVEQLKKQIFDIDFSTMIYDTWTITEAYTLVKYRGLHQGNKLYEWFGEFIESITGDKDTTFAQWHQIKTKHPEKNMKDMIIEACNVSLSRNEIFSATSDLKDTPIRLAIRASMAIPLFFTPVKIGKYEYVDGGTQQNCPITAFNINNRINDKALGIWLAPKEVTDNIENGTPIPPHDTSSLLKLIEADIEASLNTQLFDLIHSQYKDQTIFCNTLDVGTLQFDMPNDKKEALIQSGYDAVKHYVQSVHDKELSQLSRDFLEGLDLCQDYKGITPGFDGHKPSIQHQQSESLTMKVPTPKPLI